MSVKVPWSSLPPELLYSIAGRFDSVVDVLRFRSVCRSWRSAYPVAEKKNLLSPFLPCNTSVPPFDPRDIGFYERGGGRFVLTAATVYLLQPKDEDVSVSSPAGWLVTVDEFNPGRLCVRKPLSKSSFKQLPYDFPVSFNLLDFRIFEIVKQYNLTYVQNAPSGQFREFPSNWSYNFDKVVLFSDGCSGIKDFVAVVLFNGGKLVLLKLGETEWKSLHDGKGFKFDDIVVYKGKLCGINRRGRLYSINCTDLSMIVIAAPIGGGGGRRKRLIESRGELYLVVRCALRDANHAMIPKLRVYKLNEENQKWTKVMSLGDQIFFVGVDFTFSESAKSLSGCKGSCIYFAMKSFPSYNGVDYSWLSEETTFSLGIEVFHLDKDSEFRMVDSLPGYSEILWPPPNWFKQASSSLFSSVEAVETALLQITTMKEEISAWKKEAKNHAKIPVNGIEDVVEASGASHRDRERFRNKVQRLIVKLYVSFDELMRWLRRSPSSRGSDEAKSAEICAHIKEANSRVRAAMERATKFLKDINQN